VCAVGVPLKTNRSNRSPQDGARENADCEYFLANNTTQDLTGNKKDQINFVGTIAGSPNKYGAGCYE
jgi:hypothetical protein